MLAFLLAIFIFAAPPKDYYDGVDVCDLRASLHDVIDDHKRVGYRRAWDVLESADTDPDHSAFVLDLYRNRAFQKGVLRGVSYNREHTWPKSYGFPRNGSGNYPYTDCHALFICDASFNSSRGNRLYRSCRDNCTEKPVDGGIYFGNFGKGRGVGGKWEVWILRRGDVARAMFYMDVRYEGGEHGVTGALEPDLVLTNDLSKIHVARSNEHVAYMGELSVLLQWHADDPVTAVERRRNDVVFRHQRNRNPFVDHPEWVSILFGGADGRISNTGVPRARNDQEAGR